MANETRHGHVVLSRCKEQPDGMLRFEDILATPLGEIEPSGAYDETDVQACACGCDTGEGTDFYCRYDRAGGFLYCPNCLQGYLQIFTDDAGETRMRFAVADGDLAVVREYLPANYKARWGRRSGEKGRRVVIFGSDSHGWTLDGYVVPRLASGLIAAWECKPPEHDASEEIVADIRGHIARNEIGKAHELASKYGYEIKKNGTLVNRGEKRSNTNGK